MDNGWKEEDIRTIFQRSHHEAEVLANSSRTSEGKHMSREPLLFTRAEVNEEVLQGDEYGLVQTRINYYIGANFVGDDGEPGTHIGRLHHFLRVPHPWYEPDLPHSRVVEPLRVAMVSYYKLSTNKLGSRDRQKKGSKTRPQELRFIHADLGADNGKYYATEPLSIINKYVVALPNGPQNATEVFCMTYAGLTGTR